MHPNNREAGLKSENARHPSIYLATAALAIAALGCRWAGKFGPLNTGLAVNEGGRSAGGVEAWAGINDIAIDLSSAYRTYGGLARVEIIKSGMPNQILWGKELGIRNPGAVPNSPGPYIEDLR